MKPVQITGRTILITGGGSGIGRGLAEAFHPLGNKVIIGGRRTEVLAATAAANPGMEFLTLDTKDPKSIQSAAAESTRRFPLLDVIVNNAGVQRVHDFGSDEPFDEQSADEEIDTNIRGVIRMTAAFLPQLKRMSAASIINVSSGLAFVPLARYPIYCATKAFVHSFTLSLRHQLAGTGIGVLELAPPWVATDLDATHGAATSHTGIKPMPLADFIRAAMAELGSDGDELPVAGAKFLYSSGVGDKAQAAFRQINQSAGE